MGFMYKVSGEKGRNKLHYCWAICAVSLLMAFAAALLSTGMSVNLAALRSNVGLSATETSMVYTIRSSSAFAATFFVDRYFRRLGLRYGMVAAMLLGALAFGIYSIAGPSVAVYYAGSVLAGTAYAFGLMVPISIIVRRWFNKSRAFALSLASSGTGLANVVGAPVLQALIDWKNVNLAFGLEAAFLCAVAVLVLLVIRNDPSEKGLEPYGGQDRGGDRADMRRGTTAGRPAGKGVIAFLAVMTAMTSFGLGPAATHLTLRDTTIGISPAIVAAWLSVFGLTMIVGKLLCGRVTDGLGGCAASCIFGLASVLGLLGCVLGEWRPTVILMAFSMILFGFGNSIATLGYPVWAANFAGADGYIKTLEKLQLGYQLGMLLGSPLPGIIFDLTGSYTPAYLVYMSTCLLAVIGVAFVYALRKRRKI